MEVSFIRNRITQLRLNKGISEYQMSLDLGQSKSYIQGITSGKTLPSVTMLLHICDYLSVTLVEFFDSENHNPYLIQESINIMKQLDDSDIKMMLPIMRRLVNQSNGD